MATDKNMSPLSQALASVINLSDRRIDTPTPQVRPAKAKQMPKAGDIPPHKRHYMVLPWRAIQDQRINKTAAFLVLSAMCGYTNRHGETWVSQQTIADLLGVSQQAIAKQVRKLIDLGYLEQIQKGQKHFSSKYRVVFDSSITLDEVKAITPARLQEGNIEPTTKPEPVSKETAIERLGALKNILKRKDSAQPPEVV